MEIDKAGPGNVDFVDELTFRQLVDDRRRNIPRVITKRFSKAHRDVGREIAMPRIAGPFYRGTDRGDFWRLSQFRQAGNGLLYKLYNAGFQKAGSGGFVLYRRIAMPYLIARSEKLNRIDVDRPSDPPGRGAAFECSAQMPQHVM